MRRYVIDHAGRLFIATAVALVGLLTIAGHRVESALVGAADWKEWMVGDPLSVTFLVAVAVAATAAWRLARAWRSITGAHPPDDRRRRRWNLAAFAFAVSLPMLVVNARSVGRLIVYDHPRKDLGWKREVIDAASWLADHRPVILLAIVAVVTAMTASTESAEAT